MFVRAAVLLAALSFLPASALAQNAAPDAAPAAGTAMANPMQVCKTDITTLCADAGDKRGEQMRCLAKNQDKLSPDCGTAVKAMQERRAALKAACKEDDAKLCADLRGPELMACRREKTAELSKPCADAVAAMPQPAAKQ